VGPPDSPVVHWTVTVHCPVRLWAPALTLCAQSRTVHCSLLLLQTTVGTVTVTPLGTPDIPVNYSGEPLSETRSLAVGGDSLWCTGQSGAPDQGSLWFSLLL
jgi:hypothetical protein